MAWYAYGKVWALRGDIEPIELGKSITGAFYALEDVGFTTPLNVKIAATGVVQTTHSTGASGKFPDFSLERTSAVFKSGDFTCIVVSTEPLPGTPGPPGPKGDPGDAVSGDVDGGDPSSTYSGLIIDGGTP